MHISNEVLALAEEVAPGGGAVRIVDLASGVSRYLVDLAKGTTRFELECVCVDKDHEALYLGKRISDPKHFRFCRANLFASNRLLQFGLSRGWRPHIAVATGFVEYLEEESLSVLLRNLNQLLVEEGYLILSSQIKNPSRYLMENICKTSDGKSWKLFYRKPEFVRDLLEGHGFAVSNVHIDGLGMYSIFTAKKVVLPKAP